VHVDVVALLHVHTHQREQLLRVYLRFILLLVQDTLHAADLQCASIVFQHVRTDALGVELSGEGLEDLDNLFESVRSVDGQQFVPDHSSILQSVCLTVGDCFHVQMFLFHQSQGEVLDFICHLESVEPFFCEDAQFEITIFGLIVGLSFTYFLLKLYLHHFALFSFKLLEICCDFASSAALLCPSVSTLSLLF